MSQIDLLILGYLKDKQKSAYEMVKEFETWNLRYWLKISNPSIYKNIIKLCEGGYLNSRTVKEGEMPEKTIYSINEKGVLYFYELMEYSSNNIGNVYFDFNAFISNIQQLPEEKRKQLLLNFRQSISDHNKLMDIKHEQQLENKHKPDSAFLLLDLYKDFFDILDTWSQKVLEHYDS